MSEKTKIDWCDSTINFWSGCEKVSPGCTNCYITSTAPFRTSGRKHGDDPVVHESAFALARRLNNKPWVCDECGHGCSVEEMRAGKVACCESSAFHRRRIFALSLSDWLWDRVPVPVLTRALDTMRVCDQVDWLLCTKRPEAWIVRMLKVMYYAANNDLVLWRFVYNWFEGKAPKHIWVGTTVENQAMADKRIPELLKIPAAVRFLSVEPLLEPIDLAKAGALWSDMNDKIVPGGGVLGGIHWVIPGGESGRGARPCNVSWIRSIKDQCTAAKVACFVKQIGSNVHADPRDGFTCDYPSPEFYRARLQHPKGGNMDEWPEDLRVRQWPESRR